MIIFLISKPYVVTPHLHRLVKTVQMRGHNIWYYAELKYIQATLVISTSVISNNRLSRRENLVLV